MAAFFHRSQLIFEVNGRCTGFNHRFHQFKGIQYAAKTGFGIRHDRQEIIGITRIVRFNTRRPLDLIRAAEGVVDPLDHSRNGVGRVERLIRIHTGGQVRICRHLPARQINRFDACFCLLQCLPASQCAKAVDIAFFRLTMQQTPHFRCAHLRQRAFRVHRAT